MEDGAVAPQDKVQPRVIDGHFVFAVALCVTAIAWLIYPPVVGIYNWTVNEFTALF